MPRAESNTAPNTFPHRYVKNPPLRALIRRAEVEDAIVNACAKEPKPLAVACEIASLAVRWWRTN